jgi:hypothetical protein
LIQQKLVVFNKNDFFPHHLFSSAFSSHFVQMFSLLKRFCISTTPEREDKNICAQSSESVFIKTGIRWKTFFSQDYRYQ